MADNTVGTAQCARVGAAGWLEFDAVVCAAWVEAELGCMGWGEAELE